MYSCKKVTELVEKEESEKLSFMERIQLKIHLWMCPDCSSYKKQSEILSTWIKTKKDSNTDEIRLSSTAKEKIIEELKKKRTDL